MFTRIYKFISLIIEISFIDRGDRNFIRHNKSFFNDPINNKDNQILIEMHPIQPNHIAISHFSRVLSEIHDAQLVGYQARIQFELINKIKFYFSKYYKIYKSFGVNKFMNINKHIYKTLADQLANKLMSEVKSKSDLENLVVNDICFGDLIYDEYLKLNKVPTVNIKSDEYRKILFEFCILYYYWKDIFSKNNIKGLIVSHSCYFMGIPVRIAISLGIAVYQVNLQSVYFLSKKNMFPYSEFHSYKDDFEKLEVATKKRGITKAHERLKLIFEGRTDVDQPYIKNSAYSQKKTPIKILGNKKPIKILIASHSFYDSPHGLGMSLFPDFLEWLEFLGEISNQTDYEWYIKTHPGIDILDQKTIDDFVSRFEKIILIPNMTSHHQLIDEGINIVLTIHGSIGIEYAAKNITVINASLNNPHISYDFNIHPKSKEDLKDIIFNLNNYVNLNLFSENVYKCYYMKYLNEKHDIFFSNYQSIINQIGGSSSPFSSKIYDRWIDYCTADIQTKIEENLKKFVLSREYKIKSNWS